MGVVILIGYIAVTAGAVALAVAQQGASSPLPWLIGLAAYGLLGLLVVVLVGLSLHWVFDLIPNRGEQREG